MGGHHSVFFECGFSIVVRLVGLCSWDQAILCHGGQDTWGEPNSLGRSGGTVLPRPRGLLVFEDMSMIASRRRSCSVFDGSAATVFRRSKDLGRRSRLFFCVVRLVGLCSLGQETVF